MEEFTVGIDLGTTYSSVAVYRTGISKVIPNEQGNRSTPSCIAFTSSGVVVGEAAVNQAVDNPENTIYGIKQLMGLDIKDDEIQSWPFQVVTEDDQLKVQVLHKGEIERFSPQQLCAMMLQMMKGIAEKYLGVEVKEAVITCPVFFNNAQRHIVKSAAEIIGLTVLRLTNEPTAAAIAYGLKVNNTEEKNVLVFDLGGGTLDISIVTIMDKAYTVQAINSDTHLGGQDFDQRMVDYFIEEFRTIDDIDISDNKDLVLRLKYSCVKAKHILSFVSTTACIEVEGTPLKGSLTRSFFEHLNIDLFDRAINMVQTTLDDALMIKDQIDEVILVGGSTRIPKIQEMLSEFFIGKPLNYDVNPDEAVVIGAAYQAAMIQNNEEGLVLNDVCLMSLGVEINNGSFGKMIVRNTLIPTRVTKIFSCAKDNQTDFTFVIYEGEQELVKENHYLGSFQIFGVLPMPQGSDIGQLTFDIDENGILKVSCTILFTGETKTLVFCNEEE